MDGATGKQVLDEERTSQQSNPAEPVNDSVEQSPVNSGAPEATPNKVTENGPTDSGSGDSADQPKIETGSVHPPDDPVEQLSVNLGVPEATPGNVTENGPGDSGSGENTDLPELTAENVLPPEVQKQLAVATGKILLDEIGKVQSSGTETLVNGLLAGDISGSMAGLQVVGNAESQTRSMPTHLPVPERYELNELGKGALRKLALQAIECANQYCDQLLEAYRVIDELQLKLVNLQLQIGRQKEVTFGSKSERLSSLDPALGKATKAQNPNKDGKPSGINGNGDKPLDTNGDGNGDKSVGTDGDGNGDKPAGTNGDGNGDKPADTNGKDDKTSDTKTKGKGKQTGASNGDDGNIDWSPYRVHNSKPVRSVGCMNSIIEGAVTVPVYKGFTEEQLKEMVEQGCYKRLPDGSYQVVIYISLPVVLDVTYERRMNPSTKEIVAADSAGDSKLLKGSLLTSSLFARILFLRYSNGTSGPRIIRDLQTDGFKLTRQSIYRWSIQYALALARPVVRRLLEKILESGKLQSDESWMRVREDLARESKRNSVLWLVRTSELLKIPPMVVLTYTGSRSAAALAKIIRDYAGKLMSDSYSAYGALLKQFADKIELTGCLQHCRSHFVDVIQSLKGTKCYQKMTEEQRKQLGPCQILDLFTKVFEEEAKMAELSTDEERKHHRETAVKSALDKLYEKIEACYAALTSRDVGYWRTALQYAVDYKERYYAAVDDPDMPLTNSACERDFASFSIFRSNSKQVDSRLGMEAATTWFSLLQTVKENDANEQVYLQFILENLPEVLKAHNDFHWYSMDEAKVLTAYPEYEDLSYLDEYMPWSDKYKQYLASYQKNKLATIKLIAQYLTDNERDVSTEIAG